MRNTNELCQKWPVPQKKTKARENQRRSLTHKKRQRQRQRQRQKQRTTHPEQRPNRGPRRQDFSYAFGGPEKRAKHQSPGNRLGRPTRQNISICVSLGGSAVQSGGPEFSKVAPPKGAKIEPEKPDHKARRPGRKPEAGSQAREARPEARGRQARGQRPPGQPGGRARGQEARALQRSGLSLV